MMYLLLCACLPHIISQQCENMNFFQIMGYTSRFGNGLYFVRAHVHFVHFCEKTSSCTFPNNHHQESIRVATIVAI